MDFFMPTKNHGIALRNSTREVEKLLFRLLPESLCTFLSFLIMSLFFSISTSTLVTTMATGLDCQSRQDSRRRRFSSRRTVYARRERISRVGALEREEKIAFNRVSYDT